MILTLQRANVNGFPGVVPDDGQSLAHGSLFVGTDEKGNKIALVVGAIYVDKSVRDPGRFWGEYHFLVENMDFERAGISWPS